MKVSDYQIISHGYDSNQNFPGCDRGSYEEVATGYGSTSHEAYDDACEQIAMMTDDCSTLPEAEDCEEVNGLGFYEVPDSNDEENFDDHYCYVSVRFNVAS